MGPGRGEIAMTHTAGNRRHARTAPRSRRRAVWGWITVAALVGFAVAPGIESRPADAGVNHDFRADLIFANSGNPNRVCVGNSTGGFTCSDDSAGTATSYGIAVGDVNGDGETDAVYANWIGSQVCLGDGTGWFTCASVFRDTIASVGVALGDMNGDGDLDAVFAGNAAANPVCLGDGTGGFTCTDVSADTNSSDGVAIGDVNGDGDLDAVFANPNAPNPVCLGDGTGGFTCTDVSADTNRSRGVAIGDVNGDGDLDAVFANSGENRVCLGDGTGGFTCANVSADTNTSHGVAIGDVNGDDDLDAVFANSGENRVCLGDGTGGFTCANVSADTYGGFGVAIGDVNRDGDLDAVFADSGENGVCLGDGTGGFTCADVSADRNPSFGVAIVPATHPVLEELVRDRGAPGDGFGAAVAVDGDTAVVGAGAANSGGADRGMVGVFSGAAGSWELQQTLVDPAGKNLDHFGLAVALDGDVAVVGAPGDDGTGGFKSDRGAVHVFTRTDGVWSHTQELVDPSPRDGAAFGASVAVSGTTLVVGAPSDRGTGGVGAAHGAAHLFRFSDGTWTDRKELNDPSPSDGDWFGKAVAASEDMVAVGAPGQDDGQVPDKGAVEVFVKGSGGAWHHDKTLAGPSRAAWLGWSVSLSGETLVAGAYGAKANRGAVYVHRRERGNWSRAAVLTDPDGETHDRLGWSVGVSESVVVMGAPGAESNRGKVVVFDWPQAEMDAVAAGADGYLGSGVAVSGTTVVAGAPGGDTEQGTAHLWWRPTCGGALPTILGTKGNDTLVGTAGADVIAGLGGADSINARGGDDIVCAGPGNDRIQGKAGNDELYGGDGNDMLSGAAGDDFIVGGSGKDTVVYYAASAGITVDLDAHAGSGIEQGTDTITHVEDVMGSLFGDVIRGNGSGNRLMGLAGADRLYGLSGADTLIGAGNNDRIRGGHGDDLLQGKAGVDRLFGGAGDDTLNGGDGTDTLNGDEGNDTCHNGEYTTSCELPVRAGRVH